MTDQGPCPLPLFVPLYEIASPLGARNDMLKKPGNFLLSHQAPLAVPSAPEGLTSVFGMETGISPPL